MESVELRQAPWTLWIHDLTARDPYFILPVLNIAIMWSTQKLTPMSGMDPMQQKMMQTMPLIFGVVLAFLPAGLVLYQVANRSEESRVGEEGVNPCIAGWAPVT